MALKSGTWPSPTSSTATLTSTSLTSLPKLSLWDRPYNNPQIQASTIVEYISCDPRSSSAIYVYDVAEQVGFGTLTKQWAKEATGLAAVFDLQTRPGAGLTLIGRLSQGTSQELPKGTVLTAYTTPTGLATMAASFAYLPLPTPASRLVMQAPALTFVGETLALSPTLAPLASLWPVLPQNVAVLLSSTPQQTVDFASISYHATDFHVIHIFDHHSSSRETGYSIKPPAPRLDPTTTLRSALGRAKAHFFEYHGDDLAKTAIVLLNGPLARILKTLVANSPFGLGVVIVNILRPWDEEALRSVIPHSVRNVHVFDEVPTTFTQGGLYIDVFGALWNVAQRQVIRSHRFTPAQTQEYLTSKNSFANIVQELCEVQIPSKALRSEAKKIILFSIPQSPLSSLSLYLEDLFVKNIALLPRSLTDHDGFSRPGGVTASRLLLSRKQSKADLPIPYEIPLSGQNSGTADFLGVLDQNLLKSHSLLQYAKVGSTVFIASSWAGPELRANLPGQTIKLIVERKLNVHLADIKGIAKEFRTNPIAQDVISIFLAHLIFLRLYIGASATEDLVLQLAQEAFKDVDLGVSALECSKAAWFGLKSVVLADSGSSESVAVLKTFETNAIVIETNDGATFINGARLGSWHDAAKHLLFPAVFSKEGYGALRPEVPDVTFLVTCTVNKRLTPLEYDRNVFHLEFDTSGTGLRYAIGEALGVHGWNDEQEVLDFCSWYGVDPSRLITLPLPSDENKVHTRTVLQALQQQIDIFGRPGKSFYTDLADYAINDVDRFALRFIGSPEGSSTFKKLSEKDTVTFADVLQKYPSARPGVERLCELVGDIKPRHYSIASAQSVVGDRVDLLVVTVDWLTPSGSQRYGQCTRYLAGLKVGQQVTVSIKPSVMKLPPNTKQPLIMAGLGTGAAPFRAFLQHLAWLSQKGEEIGPVYYYFGSRHQGAEYLYGEEIEAFILDGVISRAGLAFSRDSAKKVYIQHKMLEDSEALAKMLRDEDGVFYLCGPTWPVPDVYQALVNALVRYKNMDINSAGEYLEGLKEEERYVLEVY